MDLIAAIPAIYVFLSNLPVVGHLLANLVALVVLLPPVLTALVALWHAFVGVFKALAQVPGLGALARLGDFLSANEKPFQALITKIVDYIALIPVPKKAPDPDPLAQGFAGSQKAQK